ncbi:MAG: exodeoxyribonuclease VII small subunit [Reichenbachiella sp.]
MAAKPKTYDEAFSELKSLAEKLESDEISIDELSKVVDRSKVLVKYCQERLRSTEASLNAEDNN